MWKWRDSTPACGFLTALGITDGASLRVNPTLRSANLDVMLQLQDCDFTGCGTPGDEIVISLLWTGTGVIVGGGGSRSTTVGP